VVLGSGRSRALGAFKNRASSPMGESIAASGIAQTSRGPFWLPMIFDSSGHLVRAGQPNPDLPAMAWSSTKDILAYSTGVVGPPAPGAPAHTVHLLDALTGHNSVPLSLEEIANVPGASDPFVLQLIWSPSGRWLAVGGSNQVTLLDTQRDSRARVLVAYSDEGGALIDWER
jgi:WD40 repeat protein